MATTSSPHDHSYHIFLSFRGSDTRKTFTDHLYTALTNSGFHTFRDNDAIHKGKSIQPELETAIKQSKIAVIVFSKHYASSKWCLNELLSIMARKTCDASYCIFPVFYDVDPTEVGNQKGRFRDAFDEFERKGEFSTERIGEWRNALKVVSKLTGKVMQDEANGHEAVIIQINCRRGGESIEMTVLSPVLLFTVGRRVSRKLYAKKNFLSLLDDVDQEDQMETLNRSWALLCLAETQIFGNVF
ncbi:TMV resistance protein N-like protein [Tanacetum coccineum]